MEYFYLTILLTLIASAFFSGMEIAFLTSNKLRIELENKQGKWHAKMLSKFTRNPSMYLGTMLLGNNIALVIFSMLMDNLLAPIIGKYIHSPVGELLVRTFLSTMLILVAAEFLPKNLFRLNPNLALTIFAAPLAIIYYILFPVVFFTTKLSEAILKFCKVSIAADKKIAFGRVDLDNYLKNVNTNKSTDQEVDHEIEIFKNALEFSSIKARECMIPRTEIVAVDISNNIDALKEKFSQTRLSKILIYDKTIDHIIGYTHSHELFKKPLTIQQILLPIPIIAESMAVKDVLTLFIQQRKSIAVVVDEFGGTSGILTTEDIIEEIFGEIEDEHDKEELIEKKLSESEFIFSGRHELFYLNEKYHLNLPYPENIGTLGGLIVNYLEDFPEINQEIEIGNINLKVLVIANNKIEQVLARVKD